MIRLGPSAAAVIEGALKGDVLGLLAWAEMEIEGVAPRLPVTVTFNPAELLNALARISANPTAPVVTREQLEEFFEQDIGKLAAAARPTAGRNLPARLHRSNGGFHPGALRRLYRIAADTC